MPIISSAVEMAFEASWNARWDSIIATMAEAYYVPISPHDAAGPVNLVAEKELSELEEDDAAVMREEMGVGESGLQRVVHGAAEVPDGDDRRAFPRRQNEKRVVEAGVAAHRWRRAANGAAQRFS